jgi:hypothetical protein
MFYLESALTTDISNFFYLLTFMVLTMCLYSMQMQKRLWLTEYVFVNIVEKHLFIVGHVILPFYYAEK